MPESSMRNAKQNTGFTLIELMITVAILGILTALTYPSYQSYVQKTLRTEAKTALMQAAQDLERCFTLNTSYSLDLNNDGTADSPAPCNVANSFTAPGGNYTIAVNPRTRTTYTLTASPVSGKPTASDTKCTSFVLDSTGNKTATGTELSKCW